MIPLREKMASFLTDLARRGIKMLEPDCPCAKALEKVNVEDALKDDIERICQATSFIEITNVISLTSRLQISSGEKKEAIKQELRKIAEDIVARVERRSGNLKIPGPCRYLLLDL